MRYLSCAETAKLVRAALKRELPGVKFGVRSHTYAGGASINVSWTDGPQSDAVDAVVKRFAGAGFDGMIDLKTYNQDWLYPDGHVESFQSEVGHSYGSTTRDYVGEEVAGDAARDYAAGVRHAIGDEGYAHGADTRSDAYQAGYTDAQERAKQGAELVHFGADYIFTERELSEGERGRLERAVVFLGGEPGEAFDGNKRYDIPRNGIPGGGHDYGSTLVYRLTHVSPADLAEWLDEEALTRAIVHGPVSADDAGGRRLFAVVDVDGGVKLRWLNPARRWDAA